MTIVHIFVFVSVFSIASVLADSHWSYEGETGPSHWGSMDPAWSACSEGHKQSPIDLKTSEALHDRLLPPILFNYQISNVSILHQHATTQDDLLNNGHTIQVNYEVGSSIVALQQTYRLVQFHFHSPSEHTLDGHSFDMEMHLVHQHVTTGKLAVIGLFMEVSDSIGEGGNEFLKSINWERLPRLPGGMIEPEGDINLFQSLPWDLSYLNYEGSLTTPPCSEIVSWFVLKTPVPISAAQKAYFTSVFPHNARPVQPLHGREVITSVPFAGAQSSASGSADGASHSSSSSSSSVSPSGSKHGGSSSSSSSDSSSSSSSSGSPLDTDWTSPTISLRLFVALLAFAGVSLLGLLAALLYVCVLREKLQQIQSVARLVHADSMVRQPSYDSMA